MSDDLSPEEILEKQKAQCIFCKIISGEIPSQKVYEDDNYLGIMDIRPASPGHVILLPKEHAPILQLLPQDLLLNMFATATRVAHAVKKATMAEKVTIFSANGYAAGQQAPHAMMHIIPRESGDGLSKLDLDELTVDQADAVALGATFAQAAQQAVTHLGRQDLLQREAPVPEPVPEEPSEVPVFREPSEEEPPDETPETQEFDSTMDALQTVLETNQELRKLIIAQPSFVEDYVSKSPKLKKLFEGVDIHALSRVLRAQDEAQKPQTGTAEKKAKDMSDSELFSFIDNNEGLRTWVLENPEQLAQSVGENPRLASFFEGVDIVELAKKYRAHTQTRGESE